MFTNLAAKSLWDPLEFIRCASSCLTSVAIVILLGVCQLHQNQKDNYFRFRRYDSGDPPMMLMGWTYIITNFILFIIYFNIVMQ